MAPIQKWAGEDENERKIKIFAEKGKSVFASLPTYLWQWQCDQNLELKVVQFVLKVAKNSPSSFYFKWLFFNLAQIVVIH